MELTANVLDNGVKKVDLVGRLDMKGTMAIENEFAFNTTTTKTAVVIDMSEVAFIASIGIRMLLTNAKSLEGRGGKMVLLNPTDLVKEALETAGIQKLLPIFDDLDAASQAALDVVE